MCYIKPPARDMDGQSDSEHHLIILLLIFVDIERLGNPGWNWESILHYIKKVKLVQVLYL